MFVGKVKSCKQNNREGRGCLAKGANAAAAQVLALILSSVVTDLFVGLPMQHPTIIIVLDTINFFLSVCKP